MFPGVKNGGIREFQTENLHADDSIAPHSGRLDFMVPFYSIPACFMIKAIVRGCSFPEWQGMVTLPGLRQWMY
jgi:hypothetical protein